MEIATVIVIKNCGTCSVAGKTHELPNGTGRVEIRIRYLLVSPIEFANDVLDAQEIAQAKGYTDIIICVDN